MNHLDTRTRYTRMVVEEAFLSLLQQKPVSKITVTEICKSALINRATFYKHYQDVPDLLEQMEQELFAKAKDSLSGDSTQLESSLLESLRYVCAEKTRFLTLGSENGDPNLMTKTISVCYECGFQLLKCHLTKLTGHQEQMLYHFLSQGAAGILRCWVQDGMQESPEDMAKFVISVCKNAYEQIEKAL